MSHKDLNQLTNAYAELSHAIRSRVEEYARLRWRGLPDYYASSIDAFVEDLVPRVQVAQEKLALLTDQYLANAHELLGYAPPSGELITEEISEGLRGAPAEVVYRRPANEVYAALHEQKTLEEAKRAGELRLLSIIGSDMQQARIRQAQRSMSSAGGGGGSGSGGEGPQYYRRVLTGRENCALCIVASTQRYKVSEVLPVHPGCDCDFQPLPKGQDLFHVLDPELLERVHEIVEERTGESNRSADGYGDLLLTVNHSEHGQILGWAGPKVKKNKLKASGEPDRFDSLDSGTSRYANSRKTARSRKVMWEKYLGAFDDIKAVGAFPPGFSLPDLARKPPKEIGEASKRGMVRGAYDSEKDLIWLNPRAENLGLTPLHEIGHAIDYFFGGNNVFASENPGSLPNQIVTALRATPTGKDLSFYGDKYLSSAKEIFARAYAQYVGRLFPDSPYTKEIKIMSSNGSIRQWGEDEFELIIPLFQTLFEVES